MGDFGGQFDNDDRWPVGPGQGGVSIYSHSYDNINVATSPLVPISSYDLQPFTSDNDDDNVNRQYLAQAALGGIGRSRPARAAFAATVPVSGNREK